MRPRRREECPNAFTPALLGQLGRVTYISEELTRIRRELSWSPALPLAGQREEAASRGRLVEIVTVAGNQNENFTPSCI